MYMKYLEKSIQILKMVAMTVFNNGEGSGDHTETEQYHVVCLVFI